MYRLPYSAAILLASIFLSHARHTSLMSSHENHSYLPSSSESDVCMKPKCVIEASNILTSLDETVDPCDDFHRFACGGWMKRVDVSEDNPSVDTFSEMQNNVNQRLRDMLEIEYKSSDPPFVKMLKDFYNTCLDLDSIEKQGSEPLKRMLSRLGGWPVLEGDKWDESTFDWLDTLITFRKFGFDHNILLRLEVYRENENETVETIHLSWPYNIVPSGSNLDLGLSDDSIAEYLKTMIAAAKLLGADESTAEKELLKVVYFLIALENSTVIQEKEESNETSLVENERKHHTVKELQEEVPNIPWLKYFRGMLNDKVEENETVYVGSNIEFITKLADLLTSTEKRVIANYMMMRAVLESAQFLSREWNDIEEYNHNLAKKSFRREEETKPRWKTCLTALMRGMELPLSSYYVRHYFNDGSKDEAMILVKYIREEFLKILEENDWMDEKTREKAEEKANALKSYIGFPEELLNDTFMMKICENLTITTSHLENNLVIQKIIADKRYSDYKKSEKKEDIRFLFILRVNAFYSPRDNSMAVPAGILHDAFYEKERPNYMNFGAIGYIIGHEVTHGFDNQGRKYDKDGSEDNWWDKESDEHFRKKVQCIIDQYDNYTTDIGEKVNGENTQNENIADNGGLKEAYRAYQSWTKDNGIEPRLPALNYTQNQLFWISAAHIWCAKIHPERLKMLLLWDPHSPDRYRVIGPMSNLEEFSRDFKCSADAPMNRKYKCKVW